MQKILTHFEFPAILPPTKLGQPKHSPTACHYWTTITKLSKVFLLYAVFFLLCIFFSIFFPSAILRSPIVLRPVEITWREELSEVGNSQANGSPALPCAILSCISAEPKTPKMPCKCVSPVRSWNPCLKIPRRRCLLYFWFTGKIDTLAGKFGKSGKQQQEKNSPNPGTTL